MLRWSNVRDLLLFEIWLNSALRISDLLSMKVGDVFDDQWIVKDYFDIVEKKTGKTNRITLTPKVKQSLLLYHQTYQGIVKDGSNYLFFNQRSYPLGSKWITRKMGWILIDRWCKSVWLKGNFWGHTLRKSWGYQARMNGISLEIVMFKLNHSSLKITQKYLWITADELAEACNKLDL